MGPDDVVGESNLTRRVKASATVRVPHNPQVEIEAVLVRPVHTRMSDLISDRMKQRLLEPSARQTSASIKSSGLSTLFVNIWRPTMP
jgi:hypothetical protein